MQAIKKIFSFLNKHPYIYFVIFAVYGWVVYRYFTLPTSLPEEMKPPNMQMNVASRSLEEGMYYRSKRYDVSKCDTKEYNKAYYCKVGWFYYTYINAIEFIRKFRDTRKITDHEIQKFLNLSNNFQAVALGGAIRNSNFSLTGLPIQKKWVSYVLEGYGMLGTYIAFRDRYHYPLKTMCIGEFTSPYCHFGVGEAAYIVGYKKEDFAYNKMAEEGAEFASVFSDQKKSENPTAAQLFATKLLGHNSDAKKAMNCLSKKHISECF